MFKAIKADLAIVKERDPAARGFQAEAETASTFDAHRVGAEQRHVLWCVVVPSGAQCEHWAISGAGQAPRDPTTGSFLEEAEFISTLDPRCVGAE